MIIAFFIPYKQGYYEEIKILFNCRLYNLL